MCVELEHTLYLLRHLRTTTTAVVHECTTASTEKSRLLVSLSAVLSSTVLYVIQHLYLKRIRLGILFFRLHITITGATTVHPLQDTLNVSTKNISGEASCSKLANSHSGIQIWSIQLLFINMISHSRNLIRRHLISYRRELISTQLFHFSGVAAAP